MRTPHISLLCVGSELLRGKINTHASTLSRRLASIGLELAEEHTLADDQSRLTQAIQSALQSSDVVILTGGLGPTFDDLTREAAAEASGRPLHLSQKLLQGIQKKFRRARYSRMPPANKRQAYLLEGAQAIENTVGTAPGQWLSTGRSTLILLPGPPSELLPMLDRVVLPRLKRQFDPGARAQTHLHFVSVPESVIDHQVRPVVKRERGAAFTILAQPGLVDLDIFVESDKTQSAQKTLDRIVRSIRQKTGKSFYGSEDDYPLEKLVMKRFVAKKVTLAVAESCTGGGLARSLTDVSGSSDYFLGGVVSYHNQAKFSLLDVPLHVLRKQGAVSKEVACAMAVGIRRELGSTWGLSITGIAGPTGGTLQKPVGLVHIALSGPNVLKNSEFRFHGSRTVIRHRAVVAALDILRQIYL